MDFRADLHCHSTCSDGTLTPEALILHAKAIGLSGLSITDHDTLEAYQVAPEIAKREGLRLGSGVEFSCGLREVNVHILGYDFDLHDSSLKALCARHHARRLERNRQILHKLTLHGMPLSEEELMQGRKLVGRPHIAQLLVKKGYAVSLKEAFQLHIGDGKPCYVRGEVVDVGETIEIVHGAKGKVFLAHPHLIQRNSIVKELLKFPFDGLECFYAKFPPDQEARWKRLAAERGLLISGGSDFHGDVKDYLPLGCSWVNEEIFNRIFQNPLV